MLENWLLEAKPAELTSSLPILLLAGETMFPIRELVVDTEVLIGGENPGSILLN